MEKVYSYIIIGSGISGAVMSSLLTQKGMGNLVLDKAKGVGGRIASRRIHDQSFNHGVHEFSIDPKQESLLKDVFDESDLIKTSIGYQFETPATAAIKKVLLKSEVKKDTKVIGIQKNDLYEIKIETGEIFKTENIIITVPAPQAIELRKDLNPEELIRDLSHVQYTKRIILFSNLENPSMKLMDDSFSNAYFESSDQDILETEGSGQFDSVKKWRYEKVLRGLEQDYFSKNGLHLIGDLFQGNLNNGVGSALSSAFALAKHLRLI